MSLSCDDVYRAESLISSASVVVCQLEVTPDTTLTALKLARKHGGKSIGLCGVVCLGPTIVEIIIHLFYFTSKNYTQHGSWT